MSPRCSLLWHQTQRAAPTFAAEFERLARLRIAVLTPRLISRLGAGDWKQAEQTFVALKALGLNVDHHLIGGPQDLPTDYDLYHAIPFNDGQVVTWLHAARPGALIVVSPVFWDSWRHRWLSEQRLNKRVSAASRYAASSLVRTTELALGWGGRVDLFSACALVLPNSETEARKLKVQFRFNASQRVQAIPNGINAPPAWADDAARPDEVPSEDYVLYPGVFSPRKNQLGFIRAMRKVTTPVVFMGGPIATPEARRYFDACRDAASPHHHFLGQVEHQSPKFYGLLRHARVCCLASSCETPGLAALEAAAMGARVAITREGGAEEYLSQFAEYFSPVRPEAIRAAVAKAWSRGRDSTQRQHLLPVFSWRTVAQMTALAYLRACDARGQRA